MNLYLTLEEFDNRHFIRLCKILKSCPFINVNLLKKNVAKEVLDISEKELNRTISFLKEKGLVETDNKQRSKTFKIKSAVLNSKRADFIIAIKPKIKTLQKCY